jgi:hypothetical protein
MEKNKRRGRRRGKLGKEESSENPIHCLSAPPSSFRPSFFTVKKKKYARQRRCSASSSSLLSVVYQLAK